MTTQLQLGQSPEPVTTQRSGISRACQQHMRTCHQEMDVLFFTDVSKKVLRPEFCGANQVNLLKAWNQAWGHGLLAWEMAVAGDEQATLFACRQWYRVLRKAVQTILDAGKETTV